MKITPICLSLATALLAACEPRNDPNALSVTLTDSPLTATFTNVGTHPIRIAEPVDGSEAHARQPYYLLAATDANGAEIPLSFDCGTFGNADPALNTITLAPGESHRHSLTLRHRIIRPGIYKLRFDYVFTLEPSEQNHLKPLWRGSASSNTIEKHLTPAITPEDASRDAIANLPLYVPPTAKLAPPK